MVNKIFRTFVLELKVIVAKHAFPDMLYWITVQIANIIVT